MIEVTNENLHGAAGHQQPLGAICLGCGRRALIPLDRIDAHSGNMKRIHELSFKCSRCGSRGVQLFLFFTVEQTVAFEQGASAAEVHALRNAGRAPDDPVIKYQRPSEPPEIKWPPRAYAPKYETPELPQSAD